MDRPIAQLLAQSCQLNPFTRANSETLAVTSVNLRADACPAIRRSYAPMGLPETSSLPRIVPADWASASSKESRLTGPARKVSSRWLLSSGRVLFATPYQSSYVTTVET